MEGKSLWYRQPAAEWEEAMPLGNGRLGAMVYGGTDWEHIQVNEESMWYGKPANRRNPDALLHLEEIRECIRQGKPEQAERLLGLAMTGCPNSAHPYQTLGDIYFKFGKGRVVSEREFRRVKPQDYESLSYRRALSLEEAVCYTEFAQNNTMYTREYFLSKPAECLVMHFKAQGEAKISFTAKLAREKYFDGVEKWQQNGILLYGNLGRGGYEFAMALCGRVKGGSLTTIGECICVEDAEEVWLYFTADTTYHYSDEEQDAFVWRFMKENAGEQSSYRERELCYQDALQALLREHMKRCLDKAMSMSYEALRQEHIQDYQTLYKRMELSIGTSDGTSDDKCDVPQCNGECCDLPTDERLKRVQSGGEDIVLEELLFAYGRYLLISCSREGGLPATLQGLWNKEFLPPWDSKYTININAEMNYWMAESCNLSECHKPLFELLKLLRENGRVTAREMYGCRGFVAHHNTDIHGDTAPQDIWYPGTYWVMGAAWLCTHLWTHYLYTQDRAFLRESFPIMAEAALFFVDFLVERQGYLVTSPSVSPENTYILPDGRQGCICEGAVMDSQILRDLFTDCLEAWKLLEEEADNCVIEGVESMKSLRATFAQILEKLPPIAIGSDGRILEWMEEYGEADMGHRHISHLFGLFPSNQITVDQTPELAEAARKTLEHRLANGGGHTGWSRAWIMNHYAKLWDGEKAHENIVQMLAKSTYNNLFDKHPPFQIDGNFGACAAMVQMLVQSSQNRLVLLPALPKSWEQGEATGICLVGNARISVGWKDGHLLQAVITADSPYEAKVQYGDRILSIAMGEGESLTLTEESFKSFQGESKKP